MKKIYALFVLVLSIASAALSQTSTTAHLLSSGPYVMNAWDSNAVQGTYPASMVIKKVSLADVPDGNSNLLGINLAAVPYNCLYNGASASRVRGFGDRGFAFIITGSAINNALCPGGDTLNSYVPYCADLLLNASGVTNISVSYENSIELLADGVPPRTTALGLAYRTSATDSFRIVPGVVPFSSIGRSLGVSATTTITLPSSLENQAYLELRWYYNVLSITGASGKRPWIRLDNINISSVTSTQARSNAFAFAVYPNPSTGSVKIQDAYTGLKSLRIANLQGKEIKNLQTAETISKIDGLPAGMYLVQIQHTETGETATQKLLVK